MTAAVAMAAAIGSAGAEGGDVAKPDDVSFIILVNRVNVWILQSVGLNQLFFGDLNHTNGEAGIWVERGNILRPTITWRHLHC
mmetsp:Transcript_23563/g.69770  ORF Transcript_23563/g.69770 Transcript_23563/m.69770 type:complete len:83 (+) Transcript_23563:152-400(+)